jgi:hemolysin III
MMAFESRNEPGHDRSILSTGLTAEAAWFLFPPPPRPVATEGLVQAFEALVTARPLKTALGRYKAACEQNHAEEILNSLIHGAGLALSMAGVYALAVAAAGGGLRQLIGCDIFGASLVLLYAASTLSHGWPGGRLKRAFLVMDQVGIYILIAGTATPLGLLAPAGASGTPFLAVAWVAAMAGSVAEVVRAPRTDSASPIPYLAMCGACLAASAPVVAALPWAEVVWLLAGGLLYVAGLAFYLRGDRRFHHAIWHAFVLGGSLCHFQMVLCRVTAAG